MSANGYSNYGSPILERLDNIRNVDALLEVTDTGAVKERVWPEAEFIVGNPPFLGDKKMRRELGDAYVEGLRKIFNGRVAGQADFVCYWFEKARAVIETGTTKRAGLIATNSIRGGASRKVLERINATGAIFNAWSDRDWILEGAAVRVSMVAFDDSSEAVRFLDGLEVEAVNADLTAETDTGKAQQLLENAGIAFIGIQKGGAFDIVGDLARAWIKIPNPNGRSNAEVLKPYINGMDIVRRPSDTYLIDFNQMSELEASEFIVPFVFVKQNVQPTRVGLKRENHARQWWLHQELRPGMRRALANLEKYITTPRVAKHRVFVWQAAPVLSDSAVVAIARDDDFTFGVLHSRIHEVWSLKQGTSLGVGNDPRYTPSTCFETFPFPRPTPAQHLEIEKWAKYLNDVRNALIAADGTRTLTGIYNDLTALRGSRDSTHAVYALLIAHERLDAAVIAAYGWNAPLGDDEILAKLLALNLERAAKGNFTNS